MKAQFQIALIAIFFLSGCVPSLHQLYTKQTLVYDDAICGKYQEGDNVWEFVPNSSDKSYALTIHEKDNKISKLDAHLVEVQGQRFLDLYPAGDAELGCGDWLTYHMVPVHLFFHVSQTEPNLVLASMNPEQLTKLLKEKPDMIQHELIKDDRVVLTDTPEKLQKFLLHGLEIPEFFDELDTLEAIND